MRIFQRWKIDNEGEVWEIVEDLEEDQIEFEIVDPDPPPPLPVEDEPKDDDAKNPWDDL